MARRFGLALVLASLSLAGVSRAADVSFSLLGERLSDGYINGTFFGLDPSGQSAPTGAQFTVFSYYNAFSPFTETLSGSDFTQGSEIDIEGGQITSVLVDTNAAAPDVMSIDYANTDANFFYNFDTSNSNEGWTVFGNIADQPDPGSANFLNISAASAAPEPTIWMTMILGLALLGGLLRRRSIGVALAA